MHQGIKDIVSLFKTSDDFNEAHAQAKSILSRLVNDSSFLFGVIEQNLADPSFLKRKRHYPTLALSVYKDELIDIVINIFPSLPDQSTEFSFQSIHHHGNLKLSTIGLSGPGYSSILFDSQYTINPESEETDMKLSKVYQNQIGQYTFCDSYVPHVVFYPTEMSSTLVLWSKSERNQLNRIKSLVPKGVSKTISPILNSLGLRKTLQLNVAEYHDFYPKDGKIMALKNRIGYPEGSNENFVQNIFHYFQSVGYNNLAYLENLLEKNTTSEVERKWIQKFLSGESIPAKFEASHVQVDTKVNNLKSEILQAAQGE